MRTSPKNVTETLRLLVRRIAKLPGALPVWERAYSALRGKSKKPSARKPVPLNAFQVERSIRSRRKLLGNEPDRSKLSLADREILGEIEFPYLSTVAGTRRITPPSSIAFLTIANDKFVPGLEGLLLSLVDVYPNLESDIFVLHDGTISEFVQSSLKTIYSRLIFEKPDISWLTDLPSSSGNHKRIGSLGYMNIEGLRKQSYERVILLDSDMLVLDDISALWRGPDGEDQADGYVEHDSIFTCYDVGVAPYAAKSPVTDKFVVNSGVISLPNKYVSEKYYNQFRELAINSAYPFCDILDRFSDQKIWNQFLSDKDVSILPVNYNCNARYLSGYLANDITFIRILHFTGAKPWFGRDYLNGDEINFKPGNGRETGAIWREKYKQLLARQRGALYREHRLANPIKFSSSKVDSLIEGQPACFFIGNGPSLRQTDLTSIQGYERFVFNWFVNHPAYDDLCPENLVLGSHMLFGGWRTQKPALPDAFLKQLYQKRWRPKIWTSFYFKPYLEAIGLHKDFDIDYVLFEKPFKRFIDQTGSANLDINGFCTDGRTGLLSLALPIAIAKGYRRFGLVGCDSNYNQASGPNYFYPSEQHQSLSTREESLTSTWTADGPGHYCYAVAQRDLRARAMAMIDFTIGGRLPITRGDLSSLPKP